MMKEPALRDAGSFDVRILYMRVLYRFTLIFSIISVYCASVR